MGVVTIFAIDGCPHCLKAKKALKDRGIPYTEINITSYPDKRSDMLSLSDGLTVPQVFFNDKHIGGGSETVDLLEKWDKEQTEQGTAYERFVKEVESQPTPEDDRLKPSTKPPVVIAPPPPRSDNDKIECPKTGEMISVLEIMSRIIEALPTSNLQYRLTTYMDSVRGDKVIDSLAKIFDIERGKALDFGKKLQERKLIHHVTNDHILSDSKKYYFRLQPKHTPNVLNSFRIWTDRIDQDAQAVVARLSKIMSKIQGRNLDEDGNVNLKACTNDVDYLQFEEEVCELQGVDMSSMNTNMKTAFIINIYNLMIKFAQIKVGVPKSSLERGTFFGSVMCNIGGDLYSFKDLENGILRANAKAPYALTKSFGKDDVRLKHALEKVDRRIHFGLNCGAKSCPPVKKFTSEDLDEELRIVASAFCGQTDNVKLDAQLNTMHLNTIFKWYKSDFVSSDTDFPKVISLYLNGENKETLQKMIKSDKKIKIQFNEYDWGAAVSNSIEFKASNLQANRIFSQLI